MEIVVTIYAVILGLVLLYLHYVLLPSKANDYELARVEKQLDELKLHVKYLETKEEGEWLAYRLARAMGMEKNEAEKIAIYTRDCTVKLTSPADTPLLKQVYPTSYTLEEAKNELNRLIAKKHDEDCLVLSKAEEKSIMDKRRREFDSNWIEVKRKPSKKK